MTKDKQGSVEEHKEEKDVLQKIHEQIEEKAKQILSGYNFDCDIEISLTRK